MTDVAEYRERAEECRRLAFQTRIPEVREQILTMAITWDSIADKHERHLAKKSARA
jgi:hypothetical protein